MTGKVIAIDGPASSGKSTIEFLLAKKLGYQFVDAGSIYRTGCAYILEKGINVLDVPAPEEVFQVIDTSTSSIDEVVNMIKDIFLKNNEPNKEISSHLKFR